MIEMGCLIAFLLFINFLATMCKLGQISRRPIPEQQWIGHPELKPKTQQEEVDGLKASIIRIETLLSIGPIQESKGKGRKS